VNVEQGKTLALVGPSGMKPSGIIFENCVYLGCGKSTIVSLIERFYDPEIGKLVSDENKHCNH
jgi:ABC-type multidrug transport system fused ATPase/permease subunit